MPVCTFCKRRFKEPRGLTVFTFDGKSIHFCSSKCRRNMNNLGRDPKKTAWVIKRKDTGEGTDSKEIIKANSENNIKETEEKKEKPETKKK